MSDQERYLSRAMPQQAGRAVQSIEMWPKPPTPVAANHATALPGLRGLSISQSEWILRSGARQFAASGSEALSVGPGEAARPVCAGNPPQSIATSPGWSAAAALAPGVDSARMHRQGNAPDFLSGGGDIAGVYSDVGNWHPGHTTWRGIAEELWASLLAAMRRDKREFVRSMLRNLLHMLLRHLLLGSNEAAVASDPMRPVTPTEHPEGGAYTDEKSKRRWKAEHLSTYEEALLSVFMLPTDVVGYDAAAVAMARALKEFADCKIMSIDAILQIVEDAWTRAIKEWGQDPDAPGKSGNESMDELVQFSSEDAVEQMFKGVRFSNGLKKGSK